MDEGRLDSNQHIIQGFGSKLIHGGRDLIVPEEPLVYPIYLTSAFITPSLARVYLYSREENPTITFVENKIAEIDGYKNAAAFSSGMAAEATLFMAFLERSSKLVIQKDIYSRTVTLAREILPKIGVEIYETKTPNIIDVVEKIKPDMVFVETISNPLVRVIDIAELSKITRSHGTMLVVDNTLATPYNLEPSKYNIDLVVYSASKYLGGHNDIIGGFVTGEFDLVERIKDLRASLGNIMDPVTAFLIDRGIKTLHIRMEKHNRNAETVAKILRTNSKIEKIYYPCLEEDDNYPIARKILKGCSGMVTIKIKGDLDDALKFMKEIKMIKPAGTFGGAESLASHPSTMSHRHLDRDERLELGITDNLIRLSIGLEDVEDIINDIEQALKNI